MRYIGSKLKLVDFIESTIKKYCGEDLSEKVFCDIFAGTGVVGRTLSPKVKKVIANDFEFYSFIANCVQLNGYDKNEVEKILHILNNIKGEENGELFNAYSDGGSERRLYFTKDNGAKLSAARNYVESISSTISYNTLFAVLLSIVDAADKIANTMATYGAYAKTFNDSSIKPIEFKLPQMAENASNKQNDVYEMDANELIKKVKGDILYLDPPYNTRQYGSNYHVLNAIARNVAPKTDSVTGLDGKYNKSEYCRKGTVKAALDNLIKNADFEWIFLSYNNEGLLSFEDIKNVLKKYGNYFVEKINHQRYKADNNRNQAADSVTEYIHVLHKGVFTPFAITDVITRYPDIEGTNFIERSIISGNVINYIDDSPKILLCPIDMTTPPSPSGGVVYAKEVVADAVKNFNEGIKEGACLGELTHLTHEEKLIRGKEVVSPMNYMGGKKKLLKQLLELFPKDSTTFVDLFCGGATVGVNAPSKKVIFNDSIKPLIDMYIYMYMNDCNEGIKYIDEQIAKWQLTQENEEAYYAFRENYNSTPEEGRHPLDLFILMAYSFNNQIRFNEKRGTFNIPFGKNRSSFNDKMRENLIGFWNGLKAKECTFFARDFAKFNFDQLPEGTFVYADPPYLISQATYNSGWDEEKERELYKTLLHMDALGFKFALSNVLENKGKRNTGLEEWANYYHFNIIHLEKSYANSYYHRKEKESKTDEVLITNYSL